MTAAVSFRITQDLLERVRADLRRPHAFAHERVGFIAANVGDLHNGGLVILAHDYQSVADSDYVDDPKVGAMMGSAAIRKALQVAYNARTAMFHVHAHEHRGAPWFSKLDLAENAKFVPNFFNVAPRLPHGALVLSDDAAAGLCWRPGEPSPVRIAEIVVVGAPLRILPGRA